MTSHIYNLIVMQSPTCKLSNVLATIRRPAEHNTPQDSRVCTLRFYRSQKASADIHDVAYLPRYSQITSFARVNTFPTNIFSECTVKRWL